MLIFSYLNNLWFIILIFIRMIFPKIYCGYLNIFSKEGLI